MFNVEYIKYTNNYINNKESVCISNGNGSSDEINYTNNTNHMIENSHPSV